jgi:hypothetical protein
VHHGGMPTRDGTRLRSRGGTFLFLCTGQCTAEERAAIFRRASRGR